MHPPVRETTPRVVLQEGADNPGSSAAAVYSMSLSSAIGRILLCWSLYSYSALIRYYERAYHPIESDSSVPSSRDPYADVEIPSQSPACQAARSFCTISILPGLSGYVSNRLSPHPIIADGDMVLQSGSWKSLINRMMSKSTFVSRPDSLRRHCTPYLHSAK